jgi:hypothetical protein
MKEFIFLFFVLSFVNMFELNPYTNVFGPKKNFKQVKDLIKLFQKEKEEFTHETFKVNQEVKSVKEFFKLKKKKAEFEHFHIAYTNTENQLINGHLFKLKNPMNHFKFLEPKNGCGKGKFVLKETSKGIILFNT